MFLDVIALKRYFSGGLIYTESCVCITSVLYLVSFIHVRKQLKAANSGINNGANASISADMKLLLIGFFLFVIMFCYGMFQLSMVVLTPNEDLAIFKNVVLVYTLISDVFSGCNPWLSVILAPTVRQHMAITVRCKKDESNRVVPFKKYQQKPTK